MSPESLERAVRRVGTFPNAHYAQIGTNTASGNENEALGPAVRCQAAASNNYYGFYQSAGTANYLFENTGATWTQLGSTGLNGSDAGDTEKLDANGSTLTPTINGSGTGTPGAQTDTTYTTGAPGITWFDSVTPAGNWDNFECTDLAGGGPLPPYPVRQQTAWRM